MQSGSLLQGISLSWWSELDVAWSWQGSFAFWNHFGSLHESANAHWMSRNRWHLLSLSGVKRKDWTKPNSADTWTWLLETAHLSACVAERGAHLAVGMNSNKHQFRLIKLLSLRQATRHIDKAEQNIPNAPSCAANVLFRTRRLLGVGVLKYSALTKVQWLKGSVKNPPCRKQSSPLNILSSKEKMIALSSMWFKFHFKNYKILSLSIIFRFSL